MAPCDFNKVIISYHKRVLLHLLAVWRRKRPVTHLSSLWYQVIGTAVSSLGLIRLAWTNSSQVMCNKITR